MNEHKKYGLYLRKSSEESTKKQIASIENQSQVLKEKAIKENLKITKIYSESKSAKKPHRREQFNKMIADLQGGVIDSVICWDLSRLSRNPTEGGIIQQLLFDGIIKEIVTYDRRYYPSDNSIMMSLELGMATEYSQALGKNVKRGQGFKVNKGIAPGKAPLGYLNTTDRTKGEKEIIPDPERFTVVRKLWDLLLTNNYSVLEILKKAKGMGLTVPGTRNKPAKPLTKTGLYKLFRNPFYYGAFKWSGKIHDNGMQIKMLVKSEFARSQEIISRRERPKSYKHKFVFGSNLIQCGCCKAAIIAEHKDKVRKDGSVNHRTYYRCTHRKIGVNCTQKSVREEVLEKEFVALLESISIPDSFVKWARAYIDQEKEKSLVKYESIKEMQRKQIDRIDKQLNKLIDLKLDDVIDDEAFKFKKELLISEKHTIENEISLQTDSQSLKIDKTIETFEFCKEAKALFEEGTIDDKKAVLQGLGSRFYLKDGKLNIELAYPLKLIQDSTKSGLTVNPRFATLETHIRPGLDAESCRLIKIGGGEEELPPLSKNDLFQISTSLA